MAIKVLTFNKISDANELWFIEPNEVPNVRIAGGGIKVLSGGSWANVTPYISKPGSPSDVITGEGFVYKNGIVLNVDNGSNGYLVQIDNRGFVLFRAMRGTVTVPKIDGYNAESNGTDNGTSYSLSAGQYALFYKDYKPTLGTYLTSDVENGTGHKINFTTMDGTEFTVYMGFGHGESRIDLATGPRDMKYADGIYRAPYSPFIRCAWAFRSSYYHVHLVRPWYWFTTGTYADDPNTTSNGVLDRILRELYVGEDSEGFFFLAFKFEHHDTTRTQRFTLSVVIKYKYDSENDIWKFRIAKKLHADTDVFNYDQGGTTTGLGCHTAVTHGPDKISTTYYGYNPNTGEWEELSFNTSGYTWRTGYRATRISASGVYDGVQIDVYAYTKYINKGGTLALSTYKHAMSYGVHNWLNHYYSEVADKTIPQGEYVAWEIEIWYAKTDVYEEDPPAETDNGTDTSFIDNYFVETPLFSIVDYPASVSVRPSESFTVNVTIENEGATGDVEVRIRDHNNNVVSKVQTTVNSLEATTVSLVCVAPSTSGTYVWTIEAFNIVASNVDDSKTFEVKVSETLAEALAGAISGALEQLMPILIPLIQLLIMILFIFLLISMFASIVKRD